MKAGEQELNQGEYTCKSPRVGLLVHVLKYGTLWLCPLISTNGQGAVKRFHCFNVKFSIDKTSNTMSLELRKYAIFYPLLFRTGNNILYLHEIKHVLSVTPHFRNKEFKELSELFRHGVHE